MTGTVAYQSPDKCISIQVVQWGIGRQDMLHTACRSPRSWYLCRMQAMSGKVFGLYIQVNGVHNSTIVDLTALTKL